MSVKPNFGMFPLGTHVFREPHDNEQQLLADLVTLKRLGFNMIKIQESWAIDEPREGEIDLTLIERIMTRAQELDLRVYLGLTMEQAPMWMWRKFPDCRLIYANNQPHEDPTQYLLPSDGKPGPCWDHPGAREAAKRFIAEVVRRLGRFDNLIAWNVWQEIGFWPNDGRTLGFCYCENTLNSFRDWLNTQYGNLDLLNQTWRTAFGSWAEVEPPRRTTANPSFVDWRKFMDEVYLARALDWRIQTIHEHDPKHRPVFSHVALSQIGAGPEWKWARTGDFFGNSNYPAWSSSDEWDHNADERSWHATVVNEMWYGTMFRAEVSRCATGRGRAFWGAEFQGGPISTQLHLGRVPDKADIRRWMLAGLASGMHAISFWNHRAEIFWQEGNGFGLLDPEGDITPRIEEASRIGQAVNRDWELFALGEAPPASIAILVNDDLYHFWQGSGSPGRPEEFSRLFLYDIRGHYARFWRLGFPVDFVNTDDLEAGVLEQYAAAVLPMPLALDADYFQHLRSYVESGGLLISEACPGRFDKYGFCPRTQMVAGGEEVFGARHLSARIVREPEGKRRWTPQERGWGEFSDSSTVNGVGDYAGHSIRISYYLQTLTSVGGETILEVDGAVAGVRHRLGRGKAVLLGTFFGLSATTDVDADTDRFFETLLREEAGIVPDRCGRFLIRRRLFDKRQAWFLINPHPVAVTESIDLEMFKVAYDLLSDAVFTSGDQVEVEAAGIRCLILSQ